MSFCYRASPCIGNPGLYYLICGYYNPGFSRAAFAGSLIRIGFQKNEPFSYYLAFHKAAAMKQCILLSHRLNTKLDHARL